MHRLVESVACASLHPKNICEPLQSGKSLIAFGKHQLHSLIATDEQGEGRPSRMGRTAYLARLYIAIDLISDASGSWNLKQRD
jgi:hypothetical protein